jgi:hypothetical protein
MMEFLVVPNVSSQIPKMKLELSKNIVPSDILLADPQFYHPSQVDVIIGAEHFYNIVLSRQLELIPEQLFLKESKLGWLAYGKIPQMAKGSSIQT